MIRSVLLTTLTVASLLASLAACSRDTGASDGGAHGHPHEETATSSRASPQQPTNRVDIPPSIRNNLGITFAEVERRRVANTIRVPGAFELRPLARHEYRLMLPGRVEFRVDQYDAVKAGDPLYRFRSPQWPQLQHEIMTAEQAVSSAGAKIEVARAALAETRARHRAVRDRIQKLAAAEFKRADLETQAAELTASIPKQEAELRAAETELANSRRAFDHAVHRASAAIGLEEAALQAEVRHEGRTVPRYRAIDWIEVAATEPGVVESLAVTDGSFVEATTRLLTTIDPTKVRFRAMGLQSDLARFIHGATARIVPPQTPGMDINDAVPAKLTIGLDADPDQRTVPLLATPTERRPWTRPGVSAFLEVVTESTGGVVLAIPRSAVVKDGITHVFFRRDPNNANKAIRVEADLGVDDGRWVEVRSGVGPNDEVVLEGAYELKLATQQSGASQKGGHFHADGSFHGEH